MWSEGCRLKARGVQERGKPPVYVYREIFLWVEDLWLNSATVDLAIDVEEVGYCTPLDFMPAIWQPSENIVLTDSVITF